MSFDELSTLLVEVESVVNARPLTYISDEVEQSSFVLTPSHLINGFHLQPTANSRHFEIISTYESLTRRCRRHKQLLNQFANSWRKDYLLGLHEVHATNSRRKGESTAIAIGDIVLLQNDTTKRAFGN